jgi:hypothetical protein
MRNFAFPNSVSFRVTLNRKSSNVFPNSVSYRRFSGSRPYDRSLGICSSSVYILASTYYACDDDDDKCLLVLISETLAPVPAVFVSRSVQSARPHSYCRQKARPAWLMASPRSPKGATGPVCPSICCSEGHNRPRHSPRPVLRPVFYLYEGFAGKRWRFWGWRQLRVRDIKCWSSIRPHKIPNTQVYM